MNVLGVGERQKRLGSPQSKGEFPGYPRYQMSNCQTATNWAVGTGCTLSNPSRTMGDGRTRTPLTITGTAANTISAADLTIPATSAARYSGIKVRLRIKPGSAYSELGNDGPSCAFYLYDSGGTNFVYWDVQLSQYDQEIICAGSQITGVGGTGAWATTTFTQFRIRQNAKAGYTNEIIVDSVEWVEAHDPGVVVFAFDDIGTSIYDTVFPIFKARGLVGSCGVITDAIGSPTFGGYDRMTVAEMKEMKAAGWDFCGHSGTHGASPFLTVANQATCEGEISSSKTAIVSNNIGNGVSEAMYWPPYGEMQASYSAAMAAQGMKVCRALGLTGAQAKNVQGGAWVKSLDNGMAHVVCLYVINTTTTAFIQGHIDCVAASGGILVILGHHIVTTPGSAVEYSTASLTTIADYVKTRVLDGRLVNKTFTQVYQEHLA